MATIFVGGISWAATEDNLYEFFSKFGKVSQCKIIIDFQTGKSKGYGFVTFEDKESAERVKKEEKLVFMQKTMNVGDAYRRNIGRSHPYGGGGTAMYGFGPGTYAGRRQDGPAPIAYTPVAPLAAEVSPEGLPPGTHVLPNGTVVFPPPPHLAEQLQAAQEAAMQEAIAEAKAAVERSEAEESAHLQRVYSTEMDAQDSNVSDFMERLQLTPDKNDSRTKIEMEEQHTSSNDNDNTNADGSSKSFSYADVLKK